MKFATALFATLIATSLFLGCQSPPKSKKSAHKTTKPEPPVPPCLKAADSSDQALLVIQWQRHASHIGHHDLSYFTFRYTPDQDDPATYESVRALICEHYVTSYTPVGTNVQFAGKQEPITKVLVDADSIVRIDAGLPTPPEKDTAPCTCR